MGRITERVREISEQLTSNGNLAGLTQQEAQTWALQVVYGQLTSRFEMQGKRKEAEIAGFKTRRFYDDDYPLHPIFSSASKKITEHVVSLIRTS